MADKNDGGDKTEQPTAKRLKDARKKGNVAKSKDLTNTIVLILWVALFGFLLKFSGDRLGHLMDVVFSSLGEDFALSLPTIGSAALDTLLVLTALFLVPIAAFGLLVEFLQTGSIITFEKVKPKMENMNPAEGVKRMFSMDNLVEVFKHILKTVLLFSIAWVVFKNAMPDLLHLPTAAPGNVGSAIWSTVFKLLAWTIGIFTIISIGDAMYQRFSYTKKLRMSRRDIKQEFKDTEGDPMIKQKRREAHQEWSQQSGIQAANDANVLIVNPTHVAIALNYDRELTPIPVVSAKGEDYVARAMREAAEDAHVPILRNVPLARELLSKCDEGDIVPGSLFDVVAEVMLWSEAVGKEIEAARDDDEAADKETEKLTPPGEDLTRYPD